MIVRRLLFVSLLLFPRIADACAPAPPRGAEVLVAAEEAIIVWDAASKTEHFIRRAQFQSTAKDFGFLVPTPTVPARVETEPAVFVRMREETREPIEHRSELDPSFTCLSLMMRGAAQSAAPDAVRVLAIENVAGYEAAMRGRTTILITHRPEPARRADRIVLVSGGGTPADQAESTFAAWFRVPDAV